MDAASRPLHVLRSAVPDLEGARAFYERLLGEPPVSECGSSVVYHVPALAVVVILERAEPGGEVVRRDAVLHVPSRAHLAAIAARAAQSVLPPDGAGTATALLGAVPDELVLSGPGHVSWTVVAR